MNHVAISVDKLGKQYRIGGLQDRYATLRDTLVETFKAPVRRLKNAFSAGTLRRPPEHIWALKDVSFEVNHGEALGIIGRNGAGKSTLLKILSRVTKPTTGSAMIYGRVGSLLEVGTGFHPELTGRENIYLNGAIMGMKKAEIDRKYEEIVDFSGIGKFIDTPVKRYSSGMYTRLAFAVAAHLEPEILVVDEVLAVGDLAFQNKCLKKMSEVAGGGRTVLFVSHNMSAISSLCPNAILLDQGEIIFQGRNSEAISHYLNLIRSHTRFQLDNRTDRKGNGLIRISRIYIEGADGNAISAPKCGEAVRFVLEYGGNSSSDLNDVAVHLMIADGTRHPLFSFLSEFSGDYLHNLPPAGKLVCSIDKLPLLPGNYDLHFSVLVGRQLADKLMFAFNLVVEDGDFYGTGRTYTDKEYYGNTLVSNQWSIEPIILAGQNDNEGK